METSAAIDTPTGEPILLEIRIAPLAYWALQDPDPWTPWLGFSHWAPWRALGLGAVFLLVAVLAGSTLLQAAVIFTTVVLAGSEVLHRRDYLTEGRLVRVSGFFGGRRKEFPLGEVETVQVFRPKLDQRFHAGNVEVCTVTGGTTFIGIADPESVAQAIINARDTTAGAQGA